MIDMSQIERVMHAQAGDKDAFSGLMQHYQSGILSVCRRYAKREEDAEDLALETFVEAYQKLGQLRNPEAFGHWLHRIAANLCRSWYRSQKAAPLPLNIDPPSVEPEEGFDDLIPLGLASLSAPHRHVLDLYYRAGLTYQEIADELDAPIGTVMSRMHRARGTLREAVVSTEENEMEPKDDLAARFRMEIELLEELAAEAQAADGITKVKADCEPMLRLRQVLETHPPRLVDLLHLSDTDDRLRHLASVVRNAMHVTMPVMASCALSEDELLTERATGLAEHWAVRVGYMGRDVYLFLDAVIEHPAEEDRKARLLVRLIQTVRNRGLSQLNGHHVIFRLTQVLLGYPEAAFAPLWEELWKLEEDDKKEYGVRKAIGCLVEPFTDATLDVVRSGDKDRILFILAQIEPIFASLSPFYPDASIHMPRPARLKEELRILLDSEDPKIVDKVRSIGVGRRNVKTDELIARSEDPSAPVRAKAIRELGKRVEVSVKQVLLERIEDEDFDVRKAAVQAYGRVADPEERQACLTRISQSGERKLMKVGARALYEGSGPRQKSALEQKRMERIRGDVRPKKHIDPIHSIQSLPEIRDYEEDELTRHVAKVCTDYSTTRRQMVMEGRHSLMVRESGIYSFTEIGEAVWRVGQFTNAAKEKLGVVTLPDGRERLVG